MSSRRSGRWERGRKPFRFRPVFLGLPVTMACLAGQNSDGSAGPVKLMFSCAEIKKEEGKQNETKERGQMLVSRVNINFHHQKEIHNPCRTFREKGRETSISDSTSGG